LFLHFVRQLPSSLHPLLQHSVLFPLCEGVCNRFHSYSQLDPHKNFPLELTALVFFYLGLLVINVVLLLAHTSKVTPLTSVLLGQGLDFLETVIEAVLS